MKTLIRTLAGIAALCLTLTMGGMDQKAMADCGPSEFTVDYPDVTLGWVPCDGAVMPTMFDVVATSPNGEEIGFPSFPQRNEDGTVKLNAAGQVPIRIYGSYQLVLGDNRIKFRSQVINRSYTLGEWNFCICHYVPKLAATPSPTVTEIPIATQTPTQIPTPTATPIPQPIPTAKKIDPGMGTIGGVTPGNASPF
jgi:hypothetical protein